VNDPIATWTPVCKPPRRLVRPVRVDPRGLVGPTRGTSRGPGWRQTSYGFYVPSDVDATVPEQRVLEQSVRLPDHGAVTGWAACRLHGAAYFDGLGRDGRTPKPVPLAIGPSSAIRGDGRVRVSRDRLDAEEIVWLQGVPGATRLRALFDEMREAEDEREASVGMDMMAAAEQVSVSQMREYAAARAGWTGVPQVRRALDLSDEDSMSPNETRMRLVWVLDAGLPRPLVNQPVFDLRGNLLGIADLFDPVAGLVGEYDGAAHRAARRHRRDVMREHNFRTAGLEYVKAVGEDLRQVDVLVDRILTTRRRAPWPAPARREWTLVPPEGWYTSPLDMMTLDERLAYHADLHGEQAM
jgi:hypothetical protein